MKFLGLQNLAALTGSLSAVDIGEMLIFGRIECYSCKKAGSDKKLYNSLDKQYQEMAKSPDANAYLSVSPFGPLTERSSRKTLIDLIATLNTAFPDYDFSSVQAEQFHKEPMLHTVVNTINSVLAPVIPDYDKLGPQMWQVIDQEIQLQESAIYSLISDPDSDPFAEDGNVWSFNYFFYNKKIKRILLFCCRAQKKGSGSFGRRGRSFDSTMDLSESEGSAAGDYYTAVYDDMDVE